MSWEQECDAKLLTESEKALESHCCKFDPRPISRVPVSQRGAYYSQALKDSGIVWSPEYLDAWLAKPDTFMPGTAMMTLGVPDPQRRADLIAYLQRFRE